MAIILRQDWKDKMEGSIARGEFTECVTSLKLALQFLVIWLNEAFTPYKIIDLGAGVKKITTKVDTCPKCHGTGKC